MSKEERIQQLRDKRTSIYRDDKLLWHKRNADDNSMHKERYFELLEQIYKIDSELKLLEKEDN